MKRAAGVLSFLFILGCNAVNQPATGDFQKISQEEFLHQPFGFEETIDSFSEHTSPTFRIQKLLRRNKHYPEKTDTIYQFKYRKSEIFFYKTHLGQEFLLAGKILNKQIALTNDIRIGMSRTDFKHRFTDSLNFASDTLEMVGEGTKYTFIFNNNKLNRINIDNYFD
ncbi:MAG: hypothetical protein V2I54_01630 [Bacteroidales bacterium]|jgi:hypothetical protein|nr:hypothetical protein [Bacteroidales bacterium]